MKSNKGAKKPKSILLPSLYEQSAGAEWNKNKKHTENEDTSTFLATICDFELWPYVRVKKHLINRVITQKFRSSTWL